MLYLNYTASDNLTKREQQLTLAHGFSLQQLSYHRDVVKTTAVLFQSNLPLIAPADILSGSALKRKTDGI